MLQSQIAKTASNFTSIFFFQMDIEEDVKKLKNTKKKIKVVKSSDIKTMFSSMGANKKMKEVNFLVHLKKNMYELFQYFNFIYLRLEIGRIGTRRITRRHFARNINIKR